MTGNATTCHTTIWYTQINAPSHTLTGVRYHPHAQNGAPRLAVLVPGAGGTYASDGLDALARIFADQGVDTLISNLTHNEHRRPPGSFTNNVAVFSQVVAQFVAGVTLKPCAVMVGGKSYGSRIALTYAANPKAFGAHRKQVAVCGVVAYGFALHAPNKTLTRDTMFADLRVPGLFIQGSHDPFGTSSQVADALQRFAGPSTLITLDGGKHDGAISKTQAPDGKKRGPAEAVNRHRDTIARWVRDTTATTS